MVSFNSILCNLNLAPTSATVIAPKRRHNSYDHRLRELVFRSGRTENVRQIGVPRSTIHGWTKARPRPVVTLTAGGDYVESLERRVYILERRAGRLPDPVFKRAVGVLEMILRTPDQRRHYDARLKWELDENTRIQTAFEEGEALGRIELILTLENLLQMQTSSDAELRGKSIEELRQRAQYLQELIRNRSSS